MAASLSLALLSACDGRQTGTDSDKTKVILIGALHGGHVGSERFGLGVMERAIRNTKPDQIFTEIPPDRLNAAIAGFARDGKVTETRVDDFPEYRDMLFPLTRDLNFEMIPVAAWSRDLADNRSAKLKAIENSPARSDEWAEYQAAQKSFNKAIAGRSDDPAFIHSSEYDALVEKRQTPYSRHFDKDLGAGGWTQINAAHNALISAALDKISEEGKTVVIIFGAWHKYKILENLEKRSDVELVDPVPLLTG